MPPSTPPILDDNFRKVANDLFLAQCAEASMYFVGIAESGYWSDDDTDYLPAMCEVLMFLQECAYGVHTAQELHAFLTLTPSHIDGPGDDEACDDFERVTGIQPLNNTALDSWSEALKVWQA